MERDISDPKLYREMSKPFDTVEQARAASSAFVDEFIELRKKHRIADVYCITQFCYLNDEGEEIVAGGQVGLGNSFEHEAMLARTLGRIQAERQAMINRLLSAKRGTV